MNINYTVKNYFLGNPYESWDFSFFKKFLIVLLFKDIWYVFYVGTAVYYTYVTIFYDWKYFLIPPVFILGLYMFVSGRKLREKHVFNLRLAKNDAIEITRFEVVLFYYFQIFALQNILWYFSEKSFSFIGCIMVVFGLISLFILLSKKNVLHQV